MEKQWTNRWICSPKFADVEPRDLLHRQLDKSFILEEHRPDLKNNHTLFRRKVELKETPKECYLDISADDYYKLYINGVYVTQGPANSYPFCYNYNHVDVSNYLCRGENVIAVHVYYQGLINRAYNSGDYRQGMIAELWADGELLIDDCWKCAEAEEYGSSRTIGYETQFDEIIDNRKKRKGWKEIGFDDSGWETAVISKYDDHVLTLQRTENVQMEPRVPLSVKRQGNAWLLDFGTELTGTLFFRAQGHAGDEVRILFGEELLTEDQVRFDMRCNCFYEDRLILDEGENELDQFEYKCFRYVQAVAADGVELRDFSVDYRHYPFREARPGFQSDDPVLDGIWEICKNAVRNCSQEAFLDCPSREKGQYLGDMTVTAHALYYLTGDTELFRKALCDFAHSTRICPGMMAVAPGSFMQEIADFSLLYPYQLLLYQRLASQASAEAAAESKDFLREMLPVAEGIEQYFDRFRNQDGLLENVKTKWNLVDWPENLRDGYDFDLSQPVVGDGCHNVINALYIGMKQCLEQIRDILGIPCKSEIPELKEKFLHAFYREEDGLFVDSTVSSHSSLHANVFPCFYGLQPEGNRIAALIRSKGLACGVYVAYFVLYGLIRMGEKELAYELIVNRTEHSWYNMLAEGATTAYEAWGREQKHNTSLCHAWAAAPIPVLMEYFSA